MKTLTTLVLAAVCLTACSSVPKGTVLAKYNCEAYKDEAARWVLVVRTARETKEVFVSEAQWNAAVASN